MGYQVGPKVKAAFEHAVGLSEVTAGVAFLARDHEATIKEQLELVVIKAPTFEEGLRAKDVTRRFAALGLKDVHIDAIGNAVGLYKGAGAGPPIVIEAHMDTVYPMDQIIEPVIGDDGFIRCPGIGDNTSGVAGLLSVVRAFMQTGIRLDGDIYFIGAVREEGMGGFGGIEFFMKEHPGIAAYVCLDGVQAGKITYQSTGMTTCMVTFRGEAGGGHAYSAFGEMANPLNAVGRAIAKIADLEVPKLPKTTFCVSVCRAGNDSSVHAIVPEAMIKINMRSNGNAELAELKQKVYKAIEDGCAEETRRWGKDKITCDIHEYFNVPAGSLSQNDPICEAAYLATEYVGKTPSFSEGGPTDASFPIGAGIPSVCLGGGEVDTHSHSASKERFPIKDTEKGLQVAFIVSCLVGGIPGKLDSVL
jgi:acetylornithine deacetylase/succinyl-diaminopimelate desuccinylase-like protein